jgi:Family of unknown function (DUF5989)
MNRWTHSLAINVGTARQLIQFFWQGKTWWLTPIVVVLVLLTAVVVFLEGSALAPFIYTLF